jgi:glycosyltransferase involved in cell wall biosynthesis
MKMEKDKIPNLVSVVIPTYNDAPYLRPAIEDLLNQTYENFELIIVNDGSTDGTRQILSELEKSFPDKIRVFHKENGGTGSALNLGFSLARGEFGTWVSSDDRKTVDFLETLVDFLKKNRDIELVVAAFESGILGNKIWRAYRPSGENKLGYETDVSGIKYNAFTSDKSFAVNNWIELNSVQCHMGINYMFTMDLKDRCGDYLLIPGEDYHMTAKMGLNSRVGYIDKVLGRHQNPTDSLSVVNRSCVLEANRKTKELINQNFKPWFLQNIPKILHIYFGSEKMSYLRAMSILSFKKMNPDWSVILYSSSLIDNSNMWKDTFHRSDTLDYSGQDYSHLLDDYAIKRVLVDFSTTPLGNNAPEAHKSDFLRWLLLYKFGGLWADGDILFHKPISFINFNEVGNLRTDNIISHYGDTGPIIYMNCIGFLGSRKESPLFVEVYNKTIKKINKNNKEGIPINYQSYGCLVMNELFPTFKHALLKHPAEKIVNLDPDAVYPIDFRHLEKMYREDSSRNFSPLSVGIHWYGGAGISQEFNNLYTPEFFEDKGRKRNTIDFALEKITNHNYVVGS